jgi:hypothetical protein
MRDAALPRKLGQLRAELRRRYRHLRTGVEKQRDLARCDLTAADDRASLAGELQEDWQLVHLYQ